MTKLLWLTPLLLIPFLGKKNEAAITVTNGTPTPPVPGAESAGWVAPATQPTMTANQTYNTFSNPGGANPGTYRIGSHKKSKALTYQILSALPFSTFGYREAQILRQFGSIEEMEPGLYEVTNKQGTESFQITYGHNHIKDFSIVG